MAGVVLVLLDVAGVLALVVHGVLLQVGLVDVVGGHAEDLGDGDQEVEEVDDLDLYLAETYGQIESSEGVWDGDGDFEDPRDWADFGMDDVSVRESHIEVGEDWESRNLDELMRRRQTYPGGVPAAIKGQAAHTEDPTKELGPQAVSKIRREAQRPGEDVPLHERKPGPVPGAVPQVAPAPRPAMKPSPSGSVEIDASFANHAQFVPAGESRSDRTGEMAAFTAPVPNPPASSSSKTPIMVIVGVVVLLCLLAVVGFLLTQ